MIGSPTRRQRGHRALAIAVIAIAVSGGAASGASNGGIPAFHAQLEANGNGLATPARASMTVTVDPGEDIYVSPFFSTVEIGLGPRLTLPTDRLSRCSAARLLASPPKGGRRACPSALAGTGSVEYQFLIPESIYVGGTASARLYNSAHGMLLLLEPTGDLWDSRAEIKPQVFKVTVERARPGDGPLLSIHFPPPGGVHGHGYRDLELTLSLEARCPNPATPFRLAHLAFAAQDGHRQAETIVGRCRALAR